MKDIADIVIWSNSIFTATEKEPINGGIAIKDDKILNVGPKRQISPYISPNTKIISAYDKLVLPGFQDFHTHFWLGSLFENNLNLSNCNSEQQIAKEVGRYANENPNKDWIIGYGWHHVRWENPNLPTKESLDKYVPDRPVLLINEEIHAAWLNTKALEIVNINEKTKNPPFGKIERNNYKQPTGFLHETAIGLVIKGVDLSINERRVIMDSFLNKVASYGITSVSEIMTLPGFELGDLDLYADYEKNQKLTVRIYISTILNDDLSQAKEFRDKYYSDKLMFSGLKQFIDGVPLTHTGYMIEPYTDVPNTRGETLYPKGTYFKWIQNADRLGFRIRLHACGDGAVRLALDAFEHAKNKNGIRDSRHAIEHVEVIHHEDIKRFKELNVIPSMQPRHMAAQSSKKINYLERLGIERYKRAWSINSLHKSGANIIFGSDYPVVGLNPLLGIYHAVTRRHNDGLPKEGFNPTEKVSLADALSFYTKAPSYGNFQENNIGSIESGKKADIIILNKDLFKVDHEEIKSTKVICTIMDGKIIYQKKD